VASAGRQKAPPLGKALLKIFDVINLGWPEVMAISTGFLFIAINLTKSSYYSHLENIINQQNSKIESLEEEIHHINHRINDIES